MSISLKRRLDDLSQSNTDADQSPETYAASLSELFDITVKDQLYNLRALRAQAYGTANAIARHDALTTRRVLTDRLVKQNAGSTRTLAPASALASLQWLEILLTRTDIQDNADAAAATGVAQAIRSFAIILDRCIVSTKRKHFRHAAVKTASSILRRLLFSSNAAKWIDIIVRELGKDNTDARSIALLAVVADITRPRQASSETRATVISSIIDCLVHSTILSKESAHIGRLEILDLFLRTDVTTDSLEQIIIPAVCKGLLRHPEATAAPTAEYIIAHVRPGDAAADAVLLAKLGNPLGNLFKSSDPATRQNGALAFAQLWVRAGETASVDLATCLTDIYMKERPAVEQRLDLLQAMTRIRHAAPAKASTLVNFALTQLSKEGNEAVTTALVRTLFAFLALTLHEPIPKSVVDQVQRGLKDKRPAVQNVWASNLLKLIGSGEAHKDTLTAVTVVVRGEWSPKRTSQQMLTSGTALAWLSMLRILLLDGRRTGKNPIEEAVLEDPSFALFSLHLTSRLVDHEQTHAALALQQIYPYINKREATAHAWATALLDLLSRLSARRTTELFIIAEPVATAMPLLVSALTRALADDVNKVAERRSRLVNAFCDLIRNSALPDDGSLKSRILLDTLVPLHDEEAGRTQAWIELCQVLGFEPAAFVRNHADEALALVNGTFVVPGRGALPPQAAAARNALQTLILADQDSLIQRLSAELAKMSALDLSIITPDSIALWVRGTSSQPPAPEAVVPKSTTKTPAKQPAKKNVTKPVSNDRDVKREQEDAESVSKVEQTASTVRKALLIIDCLNQPYVTNSSWAVMALQTASDGLLQLKLLAQQELQSTLFGLAKRSSWSQATLASVLRAFVASSDSAPNEDERDRVTNTLYKIQFDSERQEMDDMAVVITVHLILAILRAQGLACSSDEQRDEQIELALAWLEKHAASLATADVPRVALIHALAKLAGLRTRMSQEIKDALQALASCLRDTATPQELRAFTQHLSDEPAHVRSIFLTSAAELDLSDLDFDLDVYLALYDDYEGHAEQADQLWTENALIEPSDLSSLLEAGIFSDNSFVRMTSADALIDGLPNDADVQGTLVKRLVDAYIADVRPPPPEYDQFGQVIPATVKETTGAGPVRESVAYTLGGLSTKLREEYRSEVARFLFDSTHVKAAPVADPSGRVQDAMLHAGKKLVASSAACIEQLMPVFEQALRVTGASAADDHVREAAVILYGASAAHLSAGDNRISSVIDALLKAASTPSESIQIAIAECIPALITKVPQIQADVFDRTLSSLTSGAGYAERRGAAYVLAGLVNGCGIASLHKYEIFEHLDRAQAAKQDVKQRQGAILALECLAQVLGPLFEPYVEKAIPYLLNAFADVANEVRKATQDAARILMATLSGYGVSLILPILLRGLGDSAWRSKKGSVELLGAMAYCSPRQLAASLPIVIPRLTEVLTDSHAQVRNAGTQSLTQFGEVINNPEIQSLVPVLLKALEDPNRHTDAAVDALLKTSFMHYIDSPSLAILVPILQRGMGERAAGVKQKSAKIFGLLSSMTNPNDLIPHIPTLLPRLRVVLSDPVPEVRATSAKALGSLVEKLGERNFPTLVNELLDVLNDKVSSTDRQGAAQAIAEVLSGLGLERLEDTLPRILQDSRSKVDYVREGFISLLIYLPATFGPRFAPYLAKSIVPVLDGLADDSDFVREASLRAGKILIANYATKSVDLMLPELEKGMFNPQWRIRVSSLQLVGDLLFKISGISNKVSTEEDDDESPVASDAQRAAMLESLGQTRRDRVFCLIYIARFDLFAMVRSSAINIWKALVSNTPKTLKEILPTMLRIIIENLATKDADNRAIFVETLGDLMKKMGQDLMSQLLPALQEGLKSSDVQYRVGVSVAISELIRNASPEQLEASESELITTLRSSLIDPSPQVRQAANVAFDSLQLKLGSGIIDQILPGLLNMLQLQDSAAAALDALRGMMQLRAHIILPVLLPTLTKRPMTAFNLRALSSLCNVSGNALTKRLPQLLGLVLEAEINNESPVEAGEAFEGILLSVPDGAEGTAAVMNTVFDFVKTDDYRKRAAVCNHCVAFFANTKIDTSRYVQDLMRHFINLFVDGSEAVVKAAWAAQDALTKSLRKEDLERLVVPLRRAILDISNRDQAVPAFGLPKGLSAVLPIFLQGLMYGQQSIKEEAAKGLGDLAARTEPASLKLFVTQITGPLIRVIGERSSSEVKDAILASMQELLEKIPTAVKPFIPQLQRTFTKSLADPTAAVRKRAAQCLGALITLGGRIDPLVTELVTGVKNAAIEEISVATLTALLEVTKKVGGSMTPASRTLILNCIEPMVKQASEASAALTKISAGDRLAAELLGILVLHLETDKARELLDRYVLPDEPQLVHCLVLNVAIASSTQKIFDAGLDGLLVEQIARQMQSPASEVAEPHCIAAGKCLLQPHFTSKPAYVDIFMRALAAAAKEPPCGSIECKRLALLVIRAFANRHHPAMTPDRLVIVGPAILPNLRESVMPVRLAAEGCLSGVFAVVEHDLTLVEQHAQRLAASGDPNQAQAWAEYVKKYGRRVVDREKDRVEARDYDENDDLDEIMEVEQGTTFEV
ncbi:translational activator of GCN4 [Savitreella phatthalungensis]